jgi:DNA invertase Pin-like site-specific DNA recombinase
MTGTRLVRPSLLRPARPPEEVGMTAKAPKRVRYSGGSTDRPALQRLLEDIRTGKIDIIVVYKVDRLTRSLADFAKLVELFDAHAVSFVSGDPAVQ